MATPQLKYEIELWVAGELQADISKIAVDRQYTLRRNDSEELSFSMDLYAFEALCAEAGTVPQAMLRPYVTDIRVKRNGVYKFGVQVVDIGISLGEEGAMMEVRCTGFLDLFMDRYLNVTYIEQDTADIFRDLITTTQTGTNMSFGVAEGATQYATTVLRDYDYVDQNVKDALMELSQLLEGGFDFKFYYDRSFQVFEEIGSFRPEFRLTYPENIKEMVVPQSAQSLYNYIIAKGSGFGDEALISIPTDTTSRVNYGTRQKILSFNNIIHQERLDVAAEVYLDQVKDILELPQITVDGVYLDLDVVDVGDTIPVNVLGHTMLPLDGNYKIEEIQVEIDENDSELITITFDDYGV